MKEEKINIHLLGLASLCSSKKGVRHYLNGVYAKPLDSGGAVIIATDGHRCVFYYDEHAFLEDEINISNDIFDGKEFFNESKKAPTTALDSLIIKRGSDGVINSYDDATGRKWKLKNIDGPFPNTEGLFNGPNHLKPEISNKGFTGSFSINSKYMKEINALIPKKPKIDTNGIKREDSETFTVVPGPTPNQAISFYNASYEFLVLIMPMKIDTTVEKYQNSLPIWAVEFLGYDVINACSELIDD